MFSTKSIRIASYLVMSYILVAITWWAVLLYREHNALYDAYDEIRQHQIQSVNPNILKIIQMNPEELHQQRKRKSIMVLSEAIFIGLGLLVGLWVINNGYKNVVQAEKLKQNFLLSISHELKSPIASAQLAFESLRRFGSKDERSVKIIDSGLKETHRLLELVKNVLLATRLETGYLPDLQSVDLESEINNQITSLLLQYRKANITLDVHPKPLVETLDRQAFVIVCHNLIENAFKYSAEGDDVQVKLERQDRLLRLEVADQGVGIPDDEKSKIYDRFYRIGEEGKRKSKGTGLGLFLARELIFKNGGTIEVLDNKPRGSKFIVIWPIDQTIQTT
jgi:signal transduction histidine kinase